MTSSEYENNLVESYFQNFLNRSAEQPGLTYWTGTLGNVTDTTSLTVGITTSEEYQQLYPTSTAFVQSLYSNILGRQGASGEVQFWDQVLAAGVSPGVVASAFATSTESLSQSIQEFYQVFLLRPADSAGLTYWVSQAQHESLMQVLGQILSTPEFQYQAAAGTASQSFGNFFGFNQQTLATDAVTDPLASGSQTPAGALTPMDSPWGQAVVFPAVPYASIATGTAAQPTLALPASLATSISLNQGGTYQFWFQAKNPGVLLSADLPSTVNSITTNYAAASDLHQFQRQPGGGIVRPNFSFHCSESKPVELEGWQRPDPGRRRLSACEPGCGPGQHLASRGVRLLCPIGVALPGWHPAGPKPTAISPDQSKSDLQFYDTCRASGSKSKSWADDFGHDCSDQSGRRRLCTGGNFRSLHISGLAARQRERDSHIEFDIDLDSRFVHHLYPRHRQNTGLAQYPVKRPSQLG